MLVLVIVPLVVIGCYIGSIASDVADIKILLKDIARRGDDGK
jgi:hypothetical protein